MTNRHAAEDYAQVLKELPDTHFPGSCRIFPRCTSEAREVRLVYSVSGLNCCAGHSSPFSSIDRRKTLGRTERVCHRALDSGVPRPARPGFDPPRFWTVSPLDCEHDRMRAKVRAALSRDLAALCIPPVYSFADACVRKRRDASTRLALIELPTEAASCFAR